MQKELKCPKCGSTNVEEYDCFDVATEETVIHRRYFCGNCADCGADLQWVQVYKFVGYDEIEES